MRRHWRFFRDSSWAHRGLFRRGQGCFVRGVFEDDASLTSEARSSRGRRGGRISISRRSYGGRGRGGGMIVDAAAYEAAAGAGGRMVGSVGAAFDLAIAAA
jgi:hypothetical protein